MYKATTFSFYFFLLMCLIVPPSVAAQVVDIPDPNLRVAIAEQLGKASGAIITIADMANLTSLETRQGVRDLTGLESATNLTRLEANGPISGLSPLAGMTNLFYLLLSNNSISDLSPLAGLTNLKFLFLSNNSISDLSPLVENTGLGSGSVIEVDGNPLSYQSIHTHIPILQSRGISVEFDSQAQERPQTIADINNDGVVNILDLVLIASNLGQSGQSNADVNGDRVVNILDLVFVAGMFDGAAAAPAAQPEVPETLTAVEVQDWLTDARSLEAKDPIMQRGFVVLEQLLASLTPKETELLSNYPNPFNPETWIPYRLAEDAFVTLTIYDIVGQVVRTLEIGHRIASAYESQSKAIYWDGKNDVGETVASGIYFYRLSAGDFSATRKMVILK